VEIDRGELNSRSAQDAIIQALEAHLRGTKLPNGELYAVRRDMVLSSAHE